MVAFFFFLFFLLHYNEGTGTQRQKSSWIWNRGVQGPLRGDGLTFVRGLQTGSRPGTGAGTPGEWELVGGAGEASWEWKLGGGPAAPTTSGAARVDDPGK